MKNCRHINRQLRSSIAWVTPDYYFSMLILNSWEKKISNLLDSELIDVYDVSILVGNLEHAKG